MRLFYLKIKIYLCDKNVYRIIQNTINYVFLIIQYNNLFVK